MLALSIVLNLRVVSMLSYTLIGNRFVGGARANLLMLIINKLWRVVSFFEIWTSKENIYKLEFSLFYEIN